MAGAPLIPPELASAAPRVASAPFWRREPYAVFFPLGILLAWAGVGRWAFLVLSGRYDEYAAVYIFHSMAQVQGFLLAFALGFLFTMIPRRSGTFAPSVGEMLLGLAAPIATVACAWAKLWTASQAGWLLACMLLVVFVARRFLSGSATRRPPASFVWIPVALLFGIAGSIFTMAGAIFGDEWSGLHALGQLMVLQGVFVALVLGVGGLALPLMTRGETPADSSMQGRDALVMAGHAVAALVLFASFLVQLHGPFQLGLALRAAVLVAVFVLGPQLWKLPTSPGWNARIVWLSAWMIPAGFAFAALWPGWYQAGLHISYIGGLATLTLAVSTHVILGHGERSDLLGGDPWQIGALAVLMLAATVCRAAVTMQPAHREAWMVTAALFFLAATVAWLLLLVPVLAGRRRVPAA